MSTFRSFVKSPLRQTDFSHLTIQNKGSSSRSRFPAVLRAQIANKYVRPKDRVATYNLEPGDSVLVRSGSNKGSIGRIRSINRSTGQVYCDDLKDRTKSAASREKGAVFQKGRQAQTLLLSPPIHYSNLALVLPSSQSASTSASSERSIAARLKTKRIHYNPATRSHEWFRQPERVRVIARDEDQVAKGWRILPENKDGELTEIPANSLAIAKKEQGLERDVSLDHIVPWHKRKSAQWPAGQPQQTQSEATTKSTFTPLLNPFPMHNIPESMIPFQEFGNCYSRARRTDRWNAQRRDALTWKKVAWKRKQRPLMGIDWSKGLSRSDLPVTSTANT